MRFDGFDFGPMQTIRRQRRFFCAAPERMIRFGGLISGSDKQFDNFQK